MYLVLAPEEMNNNNEAVFFRCYATPCDLKAKEHLDRKNLVFKLDTLKEVTDITITIKM